MLEPSPTYLSASLVADRFEQLWRTSREVDLERFAAGIPGLSVTELVDLIWIDQDHRQRSGESTPAEEYLRCFPAVAADAELATDVIYHEFLLREANMECTEMESFLARFPQHATVLEQQICLHLAILEESSFVTLSGAETDSDDTIRDPVPEIPEYELGGLIAVGGMSLVYHARHLGLDRHVAIKFISEALLSPQSRQCFDREARTLAKLDHENIVRVFDVGVLAGRPFLVLEYVSGGTLSDHYRGHALPHRDVAKLVAVLARAIQYCHDRDIVHRDLKPGNILLAPREADPFMDAGGGDRPTPLDRWIPKVTDFGLSKLEADSTSESPTRTGAILGTPSYMAPEQARGEKLTRPALADVYALGAILYELLSGRPPHQGTTPLEVLRHVMDESPLPLHRLTSGLPRVIETICLKCLEKEPSRRYATAAALADDLDRFLGGDVIFARRASPAYRAWCWTRRSPVYVTLAAAMVCFAVISGFGLSLHHRVLRQSRADELVASLHTAQTAHVLGTIQSLSSTPEEAANALERTPAPPLDSPAWWHQQFAQVYLGRRDQRELVRQVPQARPAQLELLANLPGGWSAESERQLWRYVQDDSLDLSSRLHCAAALGASEVHDLRWRGVAATLAHALLRQPLTDLADLTRMLSPQRESLRPPLETLLRSSTSQQTERLVAASVLAEHYANEPVRIVDWLIDADPQIYPVLLAKLSPRDAAVIGRLETVFQATLPGTPPVSVKKNSPAALDYLHESITLARRRATAAITLAYLGNGELLTRLLAAAPDPTARTHAIESLAHSGLPVDWLIKTITRTSDADVCRSTILAAGQYDQDSWTPDTIDSLRTEITRALSRFPRQPGLMAAVTWLNRRMNFDPPRVTTAPANVDFQNAITERTWLNSLGQRFVVIEPSDCLLGSPNWEEEHEGDERQHPCQIPRPFAISEREVTVAEIRSWRDDFPLNPHYSNRADDAVGNISFFDAAAFCRWLSQREGIDEDQMCFPARDQIKLGMTLPDDYLERTGYRLPTEPEWELACRGGTTTSWSFGLDAGHFGAYANGLVNPANHTWPFATGKPNDFRLFDMHGNVREWCVNVYANDPLRRRFSADSLQVRADSRRLLRGGSFNDVPVSSRSARLTAEPPDIKFANVGMRLVRTLSTKRLQFANEKIDQR